MAFDVHVHKRVLKHLQTVPAKDREALLDAINGLKEDPRPAKVETLHGPNYRDVMRLRVGNYRVLYKIIDAQSAVIVMLTGHRREIYDLLDRLFNA